MSNKCEVAASAASHWKLGDTLGRIICRCRAKDCDIDRLLGGQVAVPRAGLGARFVNRSTTLLGQMPLTGRFSSPEVPPQSCPKVPACGSSAALFLVCPTVATDGLELFQLAQPVETEECICVAPGECGIRWC